MNHLFSVLSCILSYYNQFAATQFIFNPLMIAVHSLGHLGTHSHDDRTKGIRDVLRDLLKQWEYHLLFEPEDSIGEGMGLLLELKCDLNDSFIVNQSQRSQRSTNNNDKSYQSEAYNFDHWLTQPQCQERQVNHPLTIQILKSIPNVIVITQDYKLLTNIGQKLTQVNYQSNSNQAYQSNSHNQLIKSPKYILIRVGLSLQIITHCQFTCEPEQQTLSQVSMTIQRLNIVDAPVLSSNHQLQQLYRSYLSVIRHYLTWYVSTLEIYHRQMNSQVILMKADWQWLRQQMTKVVRIQSVTIKRKISNRSYLSNGVSLSNGGSLINGHSNSEQLQNPVQDQHDLNFLWCDKYDHLLDNVWIIPHSGIPFSPSELPDGSYHMGYQWGQLLAFPNYGQKQCDCRRMIANTEQSYASSIHTVAEGDSTDTIGMPSSSYGPQGVYSKNPGLDRVLLFVLLDGFLWTNNQMDIRWVSQSNTTFQNQMGPTYQSQMGPTDSLIVINAIKLICSQFGLQCVGGQQLGILQLIRQSKGHSINHSKTKKKNYKSNESAATAYTPKWKQHMSQTDQYHSHHCQSQQSTVVVINFNRNIKQYQIVSNSNRNQVSQMNRTMNANTVNGSQSWRQNDSSYNTNNIQCNSSYIPFYSTLQNPLKQLYDRLMLQSQLHSKLGLLESKIDTAKKIGDILGLKWETVIEKLCKN